MAGSGDRILVAVSGGPDSVCLLSLLHELSIKFGLSLHVAHLDHQFRGQESAADAQFVTDLAVKLGIPATIESFDVPAYCAQHGLSAQEGARKIRYAFLERTAHTVQAARIATGHTADDQAETFLMRLLRGAGPSGLSAIPPVRDNIIRPLIEITRAEVMEYLEANNRAFRTDPSNNKPLYLRNRVRQVLIPVLKQFNPRIIETLSAESNLLRDEDAALHAACDSLSREIIQEDGEYITVKLPGFNTLLPALKRRVLRYAIDRAGFDSTAISFIQINDALLFLVNAQTGKPLVLSQGMVIEREYDRFIISGKLHAESLVHSVAVPGSTIVPEFNVEVDTSISVPPSAPPAEENYRWQARFDYDRMPPYIVLRNRRAGDWFCPAGMNGSRKKLQDFFVDERVPRRQRDRVPLLCSGDDILWIVGYRTDERFLVQQSTRNMVTVRMNPLT